MTEKLLTGMLNHIEQISETKATVFEDITYEVLLRIGSDLKLALCVTAYHPYLA